METGNLLGEPLLFFHGGNATTAYNLPIGNVSIITDAEEKKVVVINNLRFKRSKRVDWNTVEEYLKEFIGECAEILDTNEMIYIGSDFPDEYTHSKDTKVLRGPNEYAKANASTAIKELIQISTNLYDIFLCCSRAFKFTC